GVVVRDSHGLNCWKSILQCELSGVGLHVGLGKRKWRLERELLNDALISTRVVIDAVAASHHGLGKWFPGKTNARRKVVAVGPHQRRREDSIEGSRLTGQYDRYGRSSAREAQHAWR